MALTVTEKLVLSDGKQDLVLPQKEVSGLEFVCLEKWNRQLVKMVTGKALDLGFGCFCWLLAGVCLHAAWQTGLQRDLLGFQRELHSSSSSSKARPLEQLFGSSLRYHDTRQGQWQNSVTWSKRW